jgi:hypothetical protein
MLCGRAAVLSAPLQHCTNKITASVIATVSVMSSMSLPITQITQCKMTGLLVNDELERMWTEAVVV